MYTTIFFDLDDTLWDTIGNAKQCLHELYNEYDISRFYPTFDDFYKVYFKNTEVLWEKYSKGLIDKPTIIHSRFRNPFIHFEEPTDEMADEMNSDFFKRITTKSTLIDGAIDLLDYLHDKYRMHIISNGFSELQDKKINGSGLGKYFDKIVLSDAIGVNKPNPLIFNHLLNKAGVSPSEVVMIGDNIDTDIMGAKNSGIDQVWFNPNNGNRKDILPTYTVQHLAEIKSIL